MDLAQNALGDVLNDGAHQYLYDAEGRTCAVYTNPVAGISTMTGYLYDADGTRIAKGSITAWSCDPAQNGFQTTNDYILGLGGEQLTEMGMGGTVPSGATTTGLVWQHANIWSGGKLLGTYDNDGLHFYLDDPLGTRRVQTDYAGVVEQTCQSWPFGDQLACTGSTQYPTEHHFTGKERDSESGNDYFGARYYASSMGRWLSPDWAESPSNIPYAILSDPQSFNLYSYGLNNPLKNRDFDGHSCDPDYSTTDKNGNMVVHAGQCHLDWWDIPGHAWVGFGNIITGQTPKQVWTGVKQMFYAYSVALPFGQIGVSLGAADGLISLGLEADGAAGAAGEGAAVEAGAQSVDVTKGNSVKNWKTNASPDQVSKTLESNGFSKSTTADGRIQFTKGDTQCTMYPKASSTGGPSMQVKVGGEVVSKVRMK